ncbi:TetR/AcrR family transcriptional regulator [Jannaschia ovalis]|uniref:TetR/AcrR family transcriptional regulator n=1 Tax=Jannaschia ovalis TaxID=3038773 RepID=A0ABY8L7A2_9RHOB|nr:TetR/AcrR family transcriptional regulator [Jannaschia sp. GRR-S6-38]WGH77262.1 TetR/AcrR family transcriptional regulator [Jannaschia sp. GRR-S6-38]
MNDVTPIKKGRKFDQVLEGARSVFLADGYEGASVDNIARAAGVSKATLYSYFADKKLLFMEVAKAECRAQIEGASEIMEEYAAPAQVLRDAATRTLGLVLSDFGQSIFRMCVAESDRFPELGREFFRTGPAVFHERMCAYLTEATRRGDLSVPDVDLAAHQFIELCHAHLFTEMVFGIRKSVTPAEVDRVVEGAVDVFLARYGA